MALDPKSGTASVTSAGFTQIVPVDETRTLLVVQNLDANYYVELGGSDSTTGYRLAAGAELAFYREYGDESVRGSLYGKAESGTVSVAWYAGRTENKNFGGWLGGPR